MSLPHQKIKEGKQISGREEVEEVDVISSYDKTSKEISLYEETDFASHHILERQDIEKWVENYHNILGEELLIITTEYDKFDKTSERLDLLAIDKEGNLVVIELKRDDSGKDVELQAIKYAAYCSTLTLSDVVKIYCDFISKSKSETIDEEEAKKRIRDFIGNNEFEELSDKPRIIIVAKEYRPEVTASVLWLRKFGIDITCIKLTPYEFSKNTIVLESTVLIPLPETKHFVIESEKKAKTLTQTQQEYKKFYEELISKLKQLRPGQYRDPTPRSYYQIPTGISGIHFEWGFHGSPRSSFVLNFILRKKISKTEWGKIRKQGYADANHKCAICGADGKLNCYEIWEYNDETYIQKLKGFIALCNDCHMIEHIWICRDPNIKRAS